MKLLFLITLLLVSWNVWAAEDCNKEKRNGFEYGAESQRIAYHACRIANALERIAGK